MGLKAQCASITVLWDSFLTGWSQGYWAIFFLPETILLSVGVILNIDLTWLVMMTKHQIPSYMGAGEWEKCRTALRQLPSETPDQVSPLVMSSSLHAREQGFPVKCSAIMEMFFVLPYVADTRHTQLLSTWHWKQHVWLKNRILNCLSFWITKIKCAMYMVATIIEIKAMEFCLGLGDSNSICMIWLNCLILCLALESDTT